MRLHPGSSGVMAAAAAIAALTVVMPTDPAPAQELPAAKDTIFARKILMSAIDMNMDEIETMLAPEPKPELADAQEHAEYSLLDHLIGGRYNPRAIAASRHAR
jgi:hypothetical protein